MGEGHSIVTKRGHCGNLPHRCPDLSSTAPRERRTRSEDSLRSTKNSRPNSKTVAPRQHWSQKSPIISPDLESGAEFFLRREIVRKLSMKRQFSSCHQNHDCALDPLTRPESIPGSRRSTKAGTAQPLCEA